MKSAIVPLLACDPKLVHFRGRQVVQGWRAQRRLMAGVPHFRAVMVAIAGLVPSILCAQAASNRDKVGAADLAWQSAVAKAAPPSTAARNLTPKSATDVQAAARQHAADQKAAAQSAKDFYVAHPTDSRVPAAKKLEAVGLLKSTSPASEDRGQAAFRVASLYVADKANPAKDRFEVAALRVAQHYKLQSNGRALTDDIVAHEKAADALFADFGATPESLDYYLRLADTADPETSHRVARKVAASSASLAQKKQAQVALDRYTLLGKPLTLALTDVDGKSVKLSLPGKYKVIYLWSAQHAAGDWAALARAQKAAPANTEWIGLALDTTEAELAGAMGKAPAKMTHCVLNRQQRAAAVSTLKARRLPYAYVLDQAGAVVAYGRPADLPAIFTRIAR